MAKKFMVALVVLVMVAMSSMVVTEAACPTIELNPCLPAAEADVEPTAECCTSLNTYISEGNDPSCLCEAAIGTAYFTDNPVDYAILIPQKCNLTYAAGTECDG